MDLVKEKSGLYEITNKIINCAYKVSNTLGAGFLEKVYENALCYELTKKNFKVKQQTVLKVKYENIIVGDYCADILVEDKVLIELKVADRFDSIHIAQCLNYLKASGLKICLLINFGKPKIEIKRIVNNL